MKVREQLILGIEGSGFSVSVGVMDRGTPRGLFYINDGSPGSEIMLETIDNLLRRTGIDKNVLQGVCATLGPGSFTSLRISLAVAESMGLGLNIPVYGVNSLELIAATMPFYKGQIKVIQNAYKGEFYTATYTTENGTPQERERIRLINPGAFFDELEEDDLVLGSGLSILEKKGLNPEIKKARSNRDFSRSISGIGVIEHFLDREVREPSLKPLEPIYIRLSDAEINYDRQFGKSR